MIKKNNKWLFPVIIAIVFISGAFSGFFAGRLMPPGPWHRRPGPPPSAGKVKAMLELRIFNRLKMTEEQRQQAMPAIDQWYENMEKLRRSHAPKYQSVFMELFDSISPLLSPEQKGELEKLKVEIKEQHFRRRPPVGPPPEHQPEVAPAPPAPEHEPEQAML